MMKYFLIQMPGDREMLINRLAVFRTYNDAELIEACEKQRKRGLTGVHGQALELLGLWTVMKERNLDCPIIIENNLVLYFREEDVK